jgi:hypothetical protein
VTVRAFGGGVGDTTLICLLFTNQPGYAEMHTRNQLRLEKYRSMI